MGVTTSTILAATGLMSAIGGTAATLMSGDSGGNGGGGSGQLFGRRPQAKTAAQIEAESEARAKESETKRRRTIQMSGGETILSSAGYAEGSGGKTLLGA